MKNIRKGIAAALLGLGLTLGVTNLSHAEKQNETLIERVITLEESGTAPSTQSFTYKGKEYKVITPEKAVREDGAEFIKSEGEWFYDVDRDGEFGKAEQRMVANGGKIFMSEEFADSLPEPLPEPEQSETTINRTADVPELPTPAKSNPTEFTYKDRTYEVVAPDRVVEKDKNVVFRKTSDNPCNSKWFYDVGDDGWESFEQNSLSNGTKLCMLPEFENLIQETQNTINPSKSFTTKPKISFSPLGYIVPLLNVPSLIQDSFEFIFKKPETKLWEFTYLENRYQRVDPDKIIRLGGNTIFMRTDNNPCNTKWFYDVDSDETYGKGEIEMLGNGGEVCMSRKFVDSFIISTETPKPKYECNGSYDFATTDFKKDDDTTLLARMIFGECDGCSEVEKTAIGQTAVNRLERYNYYGSSLQEIILKPWQYAAFKHLERKLKNPFDYNCSEFLSSLDVAEDILGDNSRKKNYLATHFYNPEKIPEPDWVENMEHIGRIGDSHHLFFKDPTPRLAGLSANNPS